MSEGLVTLFMPRRLESAISTSQQMPLEFLALAGPLLEKGYRVEIIDANVQDDYGDLLSAASRKSICLGISCLSNGPRNLDRVISEIFDLETDFIRLPRAA